MTRTVTISTQRALCYPHRANGRCRSSSDMTRLRTSSRTRGACRTFACCFWPALRWRRTSVRSGNFLDNLFSRGEPATQSRDIKRNRQPSGRVAQSDPGDISVRLDRMESALRQLTGTIEQLQYRNQQLEMQLKRMQDDTEYRFQQLGSRGGAAPPPQAAPIGPGECAACVQSRTTLRCIRSAQNPNAPGAPRTLGNQAVIAAPEPTQDNGSPVGAPGGRVAGAPLDLSTLAGNDAPPPQTVAPPSAVASASAMPVPASQMTAPSPPPQVRSAAPAGSPACDLAAVGLAAGRIRHGLRLRAA